MSRNVNDLPEERFEAEALSTVAIKTSHQNRSQSKLLTKTIEKTLKEAAFVRNDKEIIIVVSETYLIADQFQKTRGMLLGLHENCKEKFFSG